MSAVTGNFCLSNFNAWRNQTLRPQKANPYRGDTGWFFIGKKTTCYASGLEKLKVRVQKTSYEGENKVRFGSHT